jgi:hypothetical protein
LGEVINPESVAPTVDSAMEAQLSEHLPQSGTMPETVTGTLNTPQLQQAAARFTEALNQGEAMGVIAEMGLNPTGLGVEPFLRSLQEAAPPAAAASAPGAEAMDTSKAEPEEEKMDES